MYRLNGKKIDITQDLTIGEGVDAITIPAKSLENQSKREELGITEHPDPIRPDERLFFIFENEDGTYRTEDKPHDQITAPVWEKVKGKRDSVKAGGVKVGDKWFHTDDASRIQHMALNMMGANIPAGLQWKTMDGTFVTMTQALAGQVFQAVAVLDMQAFAKAEEHRAAMMQAANPFGYDFSTGWPKTYAEFVVEQV